MIRVYSILLCLAVLFPVLVFAEAESAPDVSLNSLLNGSNNPSSLDEQIAADAKVSKTYLPASYPAPPGFTFEKYISVEQTGSIDVLQYFNSANDALSVNVKVILNHFVAEDEINQKLNSFSTWERNPEVLTNTEPNGTTLFWNSDKVFVTVFYRGDEPTALIEEFLSILPPKPYQAIVPKLPSEIQNELYTSENFENPPDYINLIINSRAQSIICKNGAEEAIQLLRTSQYPITDFILPSVRESCANDGFYLAPAVSLPYDIVTCQSSWEEKLAAEGISVVYDDVAQECLIEASSKEKFIANGGSVVAFEELLDDRAPAVIELLRQRRAPRQRCTESLDNKEINCETVNQDIEPTTTIIQDGEVFTETRSQNQAFREENQRTLKYEEKLVVIEGREIIQRIEITVRDGKILVNNETIGVFPEPLDKEITEQTRVKGIRVSPERDVSTYIIDASRPAKLLFVVPIDFPISINVNGKTGEYSISKPFWSFLVGQ